MATIKIPDVLQNGNKWTVVAFLVGTFLSQLVGYIVSSRESDRVDFDRISHILIEDRRECKEELEECYTRWGVDKDKIISLEKERTKLQLDLLIALSAQMSLELAMWQKDTSGVMKSLNGAYERIFLKEKGLKATDYIGKTDMQVWGQKIGSKYWKNDLKVIKDKKTVRFTEDVLINGQAEQWFVIKYPIWHNGGVIAVGGVAIPLEGLTKNISYDDKGKMRSKSRSIVHYD